MYKALWLSIMVVLACTERPAESVAPAGSVVYPAAHPPAGMTLSAIVSAKMVSRAGLSYRGGSLWEPRVFAQGAILVRHPAGILLFDSGLGRDVDKHFQTVPWLMRMATHYDKGKPVVDQLRAVGLEPSRLMAVVLTHTHWDHVSGLADLPNVPVWVSKPELAFARSDVEATVLARQLGLQRYVAYDFDGPAYLGFAASRDVFGDGSVVLVPAPGHTPGSIIAFVHTPDGKHYALVGDLVWQREGIDEVAPKPWLVSSRVDTDGEATLALIERMHALRTSLPGLVMVPAHDDRVWQTLPALAK